MFSLLYFAATYSNVATIPTPRITQDSAIAMAYTDLVQRLPDFHGIVGIVDTSWSRYVPIEEFEQNNLQLPLVYIPPNGSLIVITESGYENRGECNTSLSAYCGWYDDKYNFDYSSRLVYGVEVRVDTGSGLAMYMVDATTGTIVDSTFLRGEWIRAQSDDY